MEIGETDLVATFACRGRLRRLVQAGMTDSGTVSRLEDCVSNKAFAEPKFGSGHPA